MSPRAQIVLITLAAAGLYLGIRQLPTGTNLSHNDFRVSGGNTIEFCDPSNPQFIPVVAVRSPVTLTVDTPAGGVVSGQPVEVTATLVTSSGKPIAPADLLVTHTRPLHLLLLDPELQDYQHVHPEPGPVPGSWIFRYTPRRAGTYRVFADFTPAATARGLYASADLTVSAPAAAIAGGAETREAGAPPASAGEDRTLTYASEGYAFTLEAGSLPVRAQTQAEFRFRVSRKDGSPAPLEPVMDALAHLVAVDAERSGFAHLHPGNLAELPPGEIPRELVFQVTIPKAGRYVIWAQVQIAGRDLYAPFWFDVAT